MANKPNDFMNIPTEDTQEELMDVVVVKENMSPASLFQETSNELFYSSITNDGSRQSQVKLFSAINDSENSLSDHLGQVIEVTDFVAHTVELEDEITKQPVKALRVVVIDVEGKGYHAISEGVVSSLQKAVKIFGAPTWKEPLKMSPVEKKTRKGFKTLTLKIIG